MEFTCIHFSQAEKLVKLHSLFFFDNNVPYLSYNNRLSYLCWDYSNPMCELLP